MGMYNIYYFYHQYVAIMTIADLLFHSFISFNSFLNSSQSKICHSRSFNVQIIIKPCSVKLYRFIFLMPLFKCFPLYRERGWHNNHTNCTFCQIDMTKYYIPTCQLSQLRTELATIYACATPVIFQGIIIHIIIPWTGQGPRLENNILVMQSDHEWE